VLYLQQLQVSGVYLCMPRVIFCLATLYDVCDVGSAQGF
jgi:hypothetical protein